MGDNFLFLNLDSEEKYFVFFLEREEMFFDILVFLLKKKVYEKNGQFFIIEFVFFVYLDYDFLKYCFQKCIWLKFKEDELIRCLLVEF